MNNIKKLTDKDLYIECKKWGAAALKARWKFAGLLPEVYRRRLYEKRRYSCIYEFAARLAGMSRDQVDQVLRLEKRFIDKPVLKAALTEGKVSANKLARIVSIATQENQQEILNKTEKLSNRALEIFVHESKMQNGLKQPRNEQKSLHVQTLDLDEDVEKQLVELQRKGIDVNDLLRKFLSEREEKIEKQMDELAEDSSHKKRYINVKIKKAINEKYGTQCTAERCEKPAEQIHHENQFSIYGSHDPHHLKPLCKGHHELAHAQDKGVQKFRQMTYV